MSQTCNYQALIEVFITPQGRRRVVLDASRVGGVRSVYVITFALALVPLLFFVIFYTGLYEMMGHATSVVAFILGMIAVSLGAIGFVWYHNKRTLRRITPLWQACFFETKPEWFLDRNDAPFREFFARYLQASEEETASKETIQTLIEAIKKENRELLQRLQEK